MIAHILFQILVSENVDRDLVMLELIKKIGVSIHYATPVPYDITNKSMVLKINTEMLRILEQKIYRFVHSNLKKLILSMYVIIFKTLKNAV